MAVQQGDIYWVRLENTGDTDPRIPHPYVVLQDNSMTVVACALTSNLKRVSLPGNVLLEAGEANLPKQSVVEVAKVATIDTTQLGDYIGKLCARRIDQILAGIRFIERSFLP